MRKDWDHHPAIPLEPTCNHGDAASGQAAADRARAEHPLKIVAQVQEWTGRKTGHQGIARNRGSRQTLAAIRSGGFPSAPFRGRIPLGYLQTAPRAQRPGQSSRFQRARASAFATCTLAPFLGFGVDTSQCRQPRYSHQLAINRAAALVLADTSWVACAMSGCCEAFKTQASSASKAFHTREQPCSAISAKASKPPSLRRTGRVEVSNRLKPLSKPNSPSGVCSATHRPSRICGCNERAGAAFSRTGSRKLSLRNPAGPKIMLYWKTASGRGMRHNHF